MRTELRSIQQRVGLTFIYITHDQGEALTMSDRVAVMSSGKIEQIGDSTAIYDHPTTSFVASFVGENNVFEGTVEDRKKRVCKVRLEDGTTYQGTIPDGAEKMSAGDHCMLFVRPEALKLASDGPADNTIKVLLQSEEFEGNMRHLLLNAHGASLRLSMINDSRQRHVARGEDMEVAFATELAAVLPHGALASA